MNILGKRVTLQILQKICCLNSGKSAISSLADFWTGRMSQGVPGGVGVGRGVGVGLGLGD
jgi:hypothetical protein